jgi:hypothetical protein
MTPVFPPVPALRLALLAFTLLGSAAAIAWLGLPRWAPEWVLRSSPFVMPAAHAAVAAHDAPAFEARIAAWGAEAVPGLCRCLRHRQVEVRRMAAQAAALQAQRGTLDARLGAALRRAVDDDDRLVRGWARRALRGPVPAARGSAAAAPAAGAPASGSVSGPDDEDDEDDDE